ncbi:hypothetical protein D5S18_00815 [Nocardia panacis]|uniref:Uncharacterized protein n=1 Tax=Nocardia panacis TaxID=2340916 RepID=A0A3A4KG14_9NOCA|nr:hypothetical protein [Nocardia panacis]RJO79849.1 hypothetical protein D5S18_00815 [Nocardia panacis]
MAVGVAQVDGGARIDTGINAALSENYYATAKTDQTPPSVAPTEAGTSTKADAATGSGAPTKSDAPANPDTPSKPGAKKPTGAGKPGTGGTIAPGEPAPSGDGPPPPPRLVWTGTASPILAQTIEVADKIIQLAAEALGKGQVQLPPTPKSPELVQQTQLPASATATQYEQRTASLRSQHESLANMDDQVTNATGTVAEQRDRARWKVYRIATALHDQLAVYNGKKLEPAEEYTLTKLVLRAIKQVADTIGLTFDLNKAIAQGSDSTGGIPQTGATSGVDPANGQGGTPAAGGGGGGGGDIMSSLMQLLTTLPMLAMPLLSVLPQLLRQQQEQNHAGRDGDTKDGNSGAKPAAAAPADPKAAPPADPKTAPVDPKTTAPADPKSAPPPVAASEAGAPPPNPTPDNKPQDAAATNPPQPA